jgi:hypothetical protein
MILAKMHPTITLILWCAIIALSLSGGAVAAESTQEAFTLRSLTNITKERKDAGLNQCIDRVRSSFMKKDTKKLAETIGKRKVFLSLKTRKSETGYYTKSQLQFIFDKMFKDLNTSSFDYSTRDITISSDNHANIRAEWTYVVLGSDTVVTEHLHFVFVKENSGWRISEIKASSR